MSSSCSSLCSWRRRGQSRWISGGFRLRRMRWDSAAGARPRPAKARRRNVADVVHEIKIKAAPERVFQALTTLQGLRGWHSTQADGAGGAGGVLTFRHADGPTFRWEVTDCVPASHVAWKCAAGPGDSVGTTV